MRKLLALAAVAVSLALAGAGWAMWGGDTGKVELTTAEVTRGAVRRVVATTGKIHALLTVEISSQLSGQIAEIYADYNTKVAKGEVIARIDPRTYEARLREAEAGLAVAKAGLLLQEAAVGRAEASLHKAKRDHDRALALQARGAVSESVLDTALAAFDGARADLEVAKAQVVNARAFLTQRQASLDSATVDLERTYLRSPVDGIVIDRVAEIGLTVAASFQAPKLFTIAEDLERIRIEAQVDEAEIGNIAVGNTATFAVDTYQDATFAGTVTQIRLQPTEQQNVVTYTVVVAADNPAGKLLPGMTANVSIVTGERAGALLVPNEALRFQPRAAALALVREGEQPSAGSQNAGAQLIDRLQAELALSPAQTEQVRKVMRAEFAAARSGGGQQEAGADVRNAIRARLPGLLKDILTSEQLSKFETLQAQRDVRFGTVWLAADDGRIEQRRLRLGLSDDKVTEILGGLDERARVVVRAKEKAR